MSAPSVPVRPISRATYRNSVSPWPLILGVLATALSLAIAVVVATTFAAPIELLGIPLRLVRSEYAWLSFVGWVLTPGAVIACYGWDAISQRRELQRNRNVILHPGWNRALRVLSGIGALIGVWHSVNISVPLSEWWGLV